MSTSNEFLTSTNYSITIEGLKGLSVGVKGFAHPTISNRPVKQTGRRLDFPHTGTKPDYGDLNVELHLDDEMVSYDILHDWLLNCAGEPKTKTITLTIYSVSGKPKRKIAYYDAFPITLGELRFESTASDDPLISLTAGFAYSRFELLKA